MSSKKIIKEIKLINFYQLYLECYDLSGEVAFYIYKDNILYDKIFYSKSLIMKYNLEIKGNYSVKVFSKKNEKIETETSESVRFDGFDEETCSCNLDKCYVIVGISKKSEFIRRILEKKYQNIKFLDLTNMNIGKKYFELKIISLNNLVETDYNVIFTNKEQKKFFDAKSESDIFNYNVDDKNCVMDIMYNMDAIELYNLARSCFEDSIIEGAEFIKKFIQVRKNSYIPYTAEIGEGTTLGYGGIGVVIHWKSKIGKNCKISQGVTIGSRGPLPVIGNNVFIGPGAKCIGGSIGNNVVIGANSVVTKDIPDNCIVAGVPARIISTDIESYKQYFKKKRG